MNIDFEKRLTNKAWWVSIISLAILLSQELGFDLSAYIPKDYVQVINTAFALLTALGVTVDTSTSGLSDTVSVDAQANTDKVETETVTVVADSASSKVQVDNPDNEKAIGQEVNHISADAPQ